MKDFCSKWRNTLRKSLWEETIFQESSLDVSRKQGGSCRASKCAVTLRTVFCQRPMKFWRVLHLFSYCWQCAKLCFEEERITWRRRIDERIKMNLQASLWTFWSADLMGGKKKASLKSCRETAAFQTQILFSDTLSISNQISARVSHKHCWDERASGKAVFKPHPVWSTMWLTWTSEADYIKLQPLLLQVVAVGVWLIFRSWHSTSDTGNWVLKEEPILLGSIYVRKI